MASEKGLNGVVLHSLVGPKYPRVKIPKINRSNRVWEGKNHPKASFVRWNLPLENPIKTTWKTHSLLTHSRMTPKNPPKQSAWMSRSRSYPSTLRPKTAGERPQTTIGFAAKKGFHLLWQVSLPYRFASKKTFLATTEALSENWAITCNDLAWQANHTHEATNHKHV